MTKDKALRLALEALENLEEHLPFDWAFDELKSLAGQNDYRENVAQVRSLIPILKDALLSRSDGEAKDEPVAWLHKETGLLRKETISSKGADWDENHWKPLYTTPPQRKPLTDEEMQKCTKGMYQSGVPWLSFGRAIEAAHGIKGET